MKKILTGIGSLIISVDNPIISDFLYDDDFEELRQNIITQRAKPYIYTPFHKEREGLYVQISQLLEFGYPFLLTDNGYFTNGASSINEAILTCVYGTLPINNEISEFSKLLKWNIIYGYYATWQIWEDLLSSINTSIEKKESNKMEKMLQKTISKDMENIVLTDDHGLDSDLSFLIKKIESWPRHSETQPGNRSPGTGWRMRYVRSGRWLH